MVYATLRNVIEQSDKRNFTLVEKGKSKEITYKEEAVYNAIKNGLISIEYLTISDKPGIVIVDNRFYINRLSKRQQVEKQQIEIEFVSSARKVFEPDKPKKTNTKKHKAETVEKLVKRIEYLEKKLQTITDKEKRADIRDEIIVKRRKLCEVQNIETSNPNNIYVHLHKTKDRNKVIQVG